MIKEAELIQARQFRDEIWEIEILDELTKEESRDNHWAWEVCHSYVNDGEYFNYGYLFS